MSKIPREPADFFERYVPEHLARLGGQFAGHSSPGAIAFDLGTGGAWSLRLDSGALVVERGVRGDTLFRVVLDPSEFEPVLVAGAERLGFDAGLERQLVAVRALMLDDDRLRLVREASGSVGLRLAGQGREHHLAITLGAASTEAPECELACTLEDLWALQSGEKSAFELMMEGKVTITGNAQLAMVLGAALG